jgi:hypothetical protein
MGRSAWWSMLAEKITRLSVTCDDRAGAVNHTAA